MIQFEAHDKKGKPVYLGTMVKFLDTKLKNPTERIGPVDEITFKADGTNVIRVLGYKSKPIPSERATVIHMSDRESLILEEFTKRGVRMSVEDV